MRQINLLTIALLAACLLTPGVASAQNFYSHWMHDDVAAARSNGHDGSNTKITVVDVFSGSLTGNLTNTFQTMSHGAWTAFEAGLVAPGARVASYDFSANYYSKLPKTKKFQVMNLSFGVPMTTADPSTLIGNSALVNSIVTGAGNQAVVVKAAGNASSAVDRIQINWGTSSGQYDAMNQALIGKSSAIFVGALNAHGTKANKQALASYSNFAGDQRKVQNHFVVVGVEDFNTNLAGTSFAAPIVSGYAAILGDKFSTASPRQVARQILKTARTDTILGYQKRVHGKGEASLSRALAPSRID